MASYDILLFLFVKFNFIFKWYSTSVWPHVSRLYEREQTWNDLLEHLQDRGTSSQKFTGQYVLFQFQPLKQIPVIDIICIYNYIYVYK